MKIERENITRDEARKIIAESAKYVVLASGRVNIKVEITTARGGRAC